MGRPSRYAVTVQVPAHAAPTEDSRPNTRAELLKFRSRCHLVQRTAGSTYALNLKSADCAVRPLGWRSTPQAATWKEDS